MKLYEKLIQGRVPMCFAQLLKYWYKEQTIQIKWGKYLFTLRKLPSNSHQKDSVYFAS